MTGPKGYSRFDSYADHRCRCGHLVYKTDQAGGSCRFCPCAAHEAPARPADLPGPKPPEALDPLLRSGVSRAGPPPEGRAGEPDHDSDYRSEQQGASGYEL